MAEDPLIPLYKHGYEIQRQITKEYREARRDPTIWEAMRVTLIGRWRKSGGEWSAQTSRVLQGDGTDYTAVSRFRNPPPAGSVAGHGVNEEYAEVYDSLSARLRVLENLIDMRRIQSGPSINISGDVGVLNLGLILGGARGSVTQLQQSGNAADLARLLGQLIDKLPEAGLSTGDTEEAAHLTKAIADEARRPGRLSAIGRAGAQALGSIVTRSSELAQIWDSIKPYVI